MGDRSVAKDRFDYNNFAGHFVSKRLTSIFPSSKPMAFVGVSVAIFVVLVPFFATSMSGRLSGTYRPSDFFLINQLTFYENGSFSAVSYGGYTENYRGRYHKLWNGGYSLRFTEGSSDGGNPVTQYEVSTVSSQYELEVEEVNEQILAVRVVPKISGWAWSGKVVYFQKIG